MNQNPTQQPKVDLKSTTSIETIDGNKIFQQGVILRKVSKFVVGADEDAVMPIPVFFDPESGKILKDTIPADIREEYVDLIVDIKDTVTA